MSTIAADTSQPDSVPCGDSTSNKKRGKEENRRRSASNTGEPRQAQSNRNGSRHNSQSAGPKGDRAGKKDWSEKKSHSQGGLKSTNKEKEGSEKEKQRTRSTNSNSDRRRKLDSSRTLSLTSNGDYNSEDYMDELVEPFSDSDEDDFKEPGSEKMKIVLPRGRIRTLSGTVPDVGYSPKWGGPTMCLSCLHFFDLPEQVEDFAQHLLKEHKIIVSEMSLIVDPKRYIEHWRVRFAKESVDKIFPKVEPKEGEPYFGETDYYFNMSEAVPEDYSLRQRLAMRRLEEALSCQQREREDRHFHLQCIFCRYTARGNRSKIIHHLYMIHHLNLGSPDNLVFVTEYIEHLKAKMQNNECIYCEKQFQDKNTLMDHMRKRNHREVNPKNHYYDKFYIINYLELGKRWLDVLAEDFEDTMATFQDSDEDEEDNSWCEWQDDNQEPDDTRVLCLMCDSNFEACNQLFDHMKEKHSLDLLSVVKENNLTFYDRTKLINYARRKNYDHQCWVCDSSFENYATLLKHLRETETPFRGVPDRTLWDNEKNLVPLFGNDHLLWKLESFIAEQSDEVPVATADNEQSDRTWAVLVEESKENTVEGVLAEDLPELHEVDSTELEELK